MRQVAASSDREFVVDPRVRAPSPGYVGDTPLDSITYPILVSILRNYGFVAVQIEDLVFIAPEANARQLPTRIVQRDDPDVSDHEVVTRIVTLGGDAARLVPILRPLLPQSAHLAASGNKLLIVDRYDNVRRITELADALSE